MDRSADTLDLLYLASPSTVNYHSPQQRSASEQKGFDMDSLEDDMKLKQWCKVHWQASFRKSLDSYNPLTYHDCCFSFSRRGYSRKYDHPEAYSFSVLKVASLRKLTSEEELHSWIRNKMQEHIKEGRTPVFPTINSPHQESTLVREDGLQCSP